ncbi:hypothetical protein HDU83_009536 [Entophlyctis luteolus]|nr:hypothetical protein HDU83_009536 [Entophlyctis luteolus]
MPIGHSWLRLVALRLGTLVLDAIPLVAVAYTAHRLFCMISVDPVRLSPRHDLSSDVDTWHTTVQRYLPAYMTIETAFFVYFHLQRRRLQSAVRPPEMTMVERGKQFYRILDSAGFAEFLAGWFYWRNTRKQLTVDEFHVVRKDDLRDWFAWSFFSAKDYASLSPEHAGELDGYVSDLEFAKNLKFQPGRNEDISPLILNYNPIEATAKPLCMYLFVWFLEILTFAALYAIGFKRVTPSQRSNNPSDTSSSVTSMTYWVYLPKRSPSRVAGRQAATDVPKLPLVFFHGIGIGLTVYVYFLYTLFTALDGSRAVFLAEFPHVSMRLVDFCPSTEQTVGEIEAMLDEHGFAKAHIVGHSLGTTVAAWMVKYSKYCASCVLLDPVVFLYLMPSLAYSALSPDFVHRQPGRNTEMKANEYLLYWACSRELYTSNAINRHFRWHQALLWPESLPAVHHVVVGKRDFLFDGSAVVQYLAENNVSVSTHDVGHAGFTLRPALCRAVCADIVRVVAAGDVDYARTHTRHVASVVAAKPRAHAGGGAFFNNNNTGAAAPFASNNGSIKKTVRRRKS